MRATILKCALAKLYRTFCQNACLIGIESAVLLDLWFRYEDLTFLSAYRVDSDTDDVYAATHKLIRSERQSPFETSSRFFDPPVAPA
jgi:hypothetical protein